MRTPSRRRDAGQTLAEVGIVLPILIILIFAILEFGWAMFQSNVIRGYVREASNLISRNGTLEQAEAAIVSASSAGGPVQIGVGNADSRMILSVIRLGAGGANEDTPIVAQRRVVGDLNQTSVLGGNPSSSAYGSAPHYHADDPEDDTSLVATLPDGYTLPEGQALFVTEIFTRRGRIINVSQLPDVLYASAFF
jgi:hypothetical protein